MGDENGQSVGGGNNRAGQLGVSSWQTEPR